MTVNKAHVGDAHQLKVKFNLMQGMEKLIKAAIDIMYLGGRTVTSGVPV